MELIRLPQNTEITKEIIEYVIKEHSKEKARIEMLHRYYRNENDEITNREYKDKNKPQNRLKNGYASYITNMAVGYFLGSPISYKYQNDNLKKLIDDTFRYNDENDINTTLAKQSSIQGYSIELLYTDADARPRMKPLKASEIALVYDNTLEDNLMYAIRYYKEKDIVKDEEYTIVEVYDKEKKTIYKLDESLTFIDEEMHYFGDVPVVVYTNNDELMGDFERQLSLINSYDKLQSDSANDHEYFSNCMLVVSGYVLGEEDAQSISDVRTLNFADSEGKAEYLVKNIQDVALENFKNRIDNDIHKFSQIPNLSDKDFGNNASGVSLQFKLMGIENITSVKESKFRKGLMRRIELLCNFLNIKTNGDMAYLDVEPIFTRTKPINELEMAQMMQTLSGILSEESILALSPFVDDVASEMERKKNEANALYEDNYSELGAINEEE